MHGVIVNSLFYRLTILKEGENKCEEIVRCITPDKLTPSGNETQEPEQNSTVAVELETVYLTEPDSYTSEHAAAVSHSYFTNIVTTHYMRVKLRALNLQCYKKRNCTNAKLKTMCASDGNEYPSRCHAKLEQCLTGHKINILHPGECKFVCVNIVYRNHYNDPSTLNYLMQAYHPLLHQLLRHLTALKSENHS